MKRPNRLRKFILVAVGVGCMQWFVYVFLLNSNPRVESRQKFVSFPNWIIGDLLKVTSSSPAKISCSRCNHLVFIKNHKCASDTITDIFFRVGRSNNLTFVLPKTSWEIAYDLGLKNWINIIPPPPGKSFDMLVLHAVYDRPILYQLMPNNTVYVGVVREPLYHTRSAIYYFAPRLIPGDNKLSVFLNDTHRYSGRFLLNSMSYEMGLQKAHFQNKTRIKEHLKSLDKEFTLIMLVERLAESLILLRRLLCWTLEDLLFITKNKGRWRPATNITDAEREKHEQLAVADYMLYDFSAQRLQRQIDSQGPGFVVEVSHYEIVLGNVQMHCTRSSRDGPPLIIPATDWNKAINITSEKCKSMKYGGLQMIEMTKAYQYPEMKFDPIV